jgi:hypothetical protein
MLTSAWLQGMHEHFEIFGQSFLFFIAISKTANQKFFNGCKQSFIFVMRRSFYVPDSIVVILAKLVLLNIALVVTISGLYAGVLLFAAFFTLLERKFMGL